MTDDRDCFQCGAALSSGTDLCATCGMLNLLHQVRTKEGVIYGPKYLELDSKIIQINQISKRLSKVAQEMLQKNSPEFYATAEKAILMVDKKIEQFKERFGADDEHYIQMAGIYNQMLTKLKRGQKDEQCI